jgi:TPP-dependent pyruvate/acetoin dehydrogenase alpha subunit
MQSFSESEAIAMIRLRHSMHQLNEMLKAGAFVIPIHLGFGYEAAAVAMDLTMGPDDVLCLTHRNAAYNLARSKSLRTVLAHYRLEPRPDGLAQLGSMNLAVEGTGIAYSSSILGNNLAVACGIAMHRSLVRRPGMVFVATGDGGIEEGIFWESLIFARTHRLGLIIVVENNNCSMSSSIEERRCPIDLSLVCAGVGVPYRRASGVSLSGVKAVLGAARGDASGGQPSVVELDITAFNQHAGPTPGWPGDPMRIALEDGLLLGGDTDPLCQLHHSLGSAEFDRLSEQVIRENRVG